MRVILYSFLAGCIVFVVLLSRNPRNISHVAKVKFCKIEMTTFREALKAYELAFGSLPSGDHITIVNCLRGQNPKNLVFLDTDIRSLDANQSFVDPWRTPNQFQRVSTNKVSVRSAGPNKQFGDEDDIVSPP